LKEVNRPRMWVEQCGKSEAAMLTFYPDIESSNADMNITLMIDCSVNMKGCWRDVIQQTLLYLQLLPRHARYNIVAVGVKVQDLYPAHFISRNVDLVTQWLLSLAPSDTFCSLWEPLYAYLTQAKISSSSAVHSIVFLSNGTITYPALTLGLVREFGPNIRLFTNLASVEGNGHYMRQLAKEGGGICQVFSSKERAKWKAKVQAVLGRCSEAALHSVSIVWRMYNSGDTVHQAPLSINSLYNGHRQVVYGYTKNCRYWQGEWSLVRKVSVQIL